MAPTSQKFDDSTTMLGDLSGDAQILRHNWSNARIVDDAQHNHTSCVQRWSPAEMLLKQLEGAGDTDLPGLFVPTLEWPCSAMRLPFSTLHDVQLFACRA
jgi:hypothetical protein